MDWSAANPVPWKR